VHMTSAVQAVQEADPNALIFFSGLPYTKPTLNLSHWARS
jgi:hypothetical protein